MNLANGILQLLENQLEAALYGEQARKHLDSWHLSFQSARATLWGRLQLSLGHN